MTEREPVIWARPSDPAATDPLPDLTELPEPPFEVEDRTAPEFKALLTELVFLRKWVESEREAGRKPN